MEEQAYNAPQSLKLAPDIFDQLQAEEKRVTIRKGRRDIQLGILDFVCTSGTRGATVNVTSVEYTSLVMVTQDDLVSDGFKNIAELYDTMKRFYPDITLKDEVTIIRF
jgi:hypothetical protein